ncbi:MAG: protein-glutamate O-methyltransferase CheR [Candidatus Wallbacteria bacterium]
MLEISFAPLSHQEFRLFADLIYKVAGISLRDSKIALVSNRLRKRLKAIGLDSYKSYYEYISGNTKKAQDEMPFFIDAITTNETYFFRHETDFEFLKSVVIPEVMARQTGSYKSLKVWSAASSTGEEPYSLAITIAESLVNYPNCNVQLLGTDINMEVLRACERATYGPYAVSRMTQAAINKYFEKLKPEDPDDEERYVVKPEYKKFIKFKRHNLKDIMLGVKFDCIFCRNVLIYFDNESKTHVIENLYNTLNDGGYLILGHAESLMRIKSNFKYVRPSIYKK